jgi:hypothetical protein
VVVSGLMETLPVAMGHLLASAQTADTVAFSRSESGPDSSGRPANLVDSIRFELNRADSEAATNQ